MKYTILLLFIFPITFLIQAQQISFERLDLFSAEISKLQSSANGLTYRATNADYEISFPEENFKVYYYNLLATNSVYKKTGAVETLEVTENVDLSRVVSVKAISNESNVIQFRLEFPAGSLSTQKYGSGGSLLEIAEMSYLDFYSGKNQGKLYGEIVKLCHYLKKEKNGFTYDIEELAQKWEVAVNTKTVAGFQDFLKKYPNTLYDAQAKLEIQQIEKAAHEEKIRLEKIQIEKERIRALEEANRIKENQRIAEEARLKELRDVAFGAFRIGYVSPTNDQSKVLMQTPAYLMNGQPFYGTENTPFTVPYTTGKFGLSAGFSGGFTGIAHLEFINKKMPPHLGFGIPLDFNVAMMRYSWTDFAQNSEDYSFLYTDAKYSAWYVVSIGAGLSFSIRPTDNIFIDLIARPDFYLTAGGQFETEGSKDNKDYMIEASRYDNSFGIGRTLGINFRYKHLLLGFELKNGIIDQQYFMENSHITENGQSMNSSYRVSTPKLDLSYMQMTLGVLF